jgi:hypothetical protein
MLVIAFPLYGRNDVMTPVKKQVCDVRSEHQNKIYERVWNQVYTQVFQQVWDQIEEQARHQIYDQFKSKMQ